MKRKRGLRPAVVAVMGTGILALGASGLATAGLKTKSATTSVGEREADSIEAKCKRGAKAISGGFYAEESIVGDNPFNLIFESQKTGGRRWESAAYNAGNGPASLTSLVYCRDEKVKRSSSETTLSDSETGSVTAKCPRGTKALSGGFSTENFFVGLVDARAPLPFESRLSSKREWTASARNLGNLSGTFSAQVVCHEGKRLKTTTDSTAAPDDGTYDLVATCKRGTRAVSGGFESSIPPQGEGGPWAFSSQRQGKRHWAVSFFVTYFDGIKATFTAYAYCEKTG
jgi:hypothetical protein